MSDILWYTLIGPIVTAVLAPFVIHFLAKRLDPLAEPLCKLEVAIVANSFQMPADLENFLRTRYAETGDARNYELSRIKSYTRVVLHNHSNKKISGVAVRLSRYYDFIVQTDDSQTLHLAKEKLVVIGDILPYQERMIHLWSSSDVTHHPVPADWFNVSANEIDAPLFSYPFPLYIERYIAAQQPPPLKERLRRLLQPRTSRGLM